LRHGWLGGCCKIMAIGAGLLASQAQADLLNNINQLRHRDCGRASKQLPQLRRSAGLDAVALQWSKGGRLTEALARTRYPTSRSASMQVQHTREDVKITQLLRENYCSILTEPVYSEIGLYRHTDHVWIVVAARLVLPTSSDAATVQQRVLELVNAARGQARNCGATAFAAAPALRRSQALTDAASMHAQDMARHSHFQHQGTDGSSPAQRATRAGYRWSLVAENIASGIATAEGVVSGWLDSPGHCASIMHPEFTEMGVAYSTDLNSQHRIYWSQVFAVPR
jgi:uncharacterized protein YkwD